MGVAMTFWIHAWKGMRRDRGDWTEATGIDQAMEGARVLRRQGFEVEIHWKNEGEDPRESERENGKEATD